MNALGIARQFELTQPWVATVDEQIKTPSAPWGIISFEFAFSPQAAQAMLSSWSPTQKLWVAFSLGLDVLLIVLYSFSVALACMYVGAGDELGAFTALGLYATNLAWCARAPVGRACASQTCSARCVLLQLGGQQLTLDEAQTLPRRSSWPLFSMCWKTAL